MPTGAIKTIRKAILIAFVVMIVIIIIHASPSMHSHYSLGVSNPSDNVSEEEKKKPVLPELTVEQHKHAKTNWKKGLKGAKKVN